MALSFHPSLASGEMKKLEKDKKETRFVSEKRKQSSQETNKIEEVNLFKFFFRKQRKMKKTTKMKKKMGL